MADDDDLPISAESEPGIKDDPNPAGGRKRLDMGENGREKPRLRRPERVAQPVSPKEKLISVLTGGRGPAQQQEAIINAVESAFGIGEADPMWVFLLPPLLQGGRADDNMAEVRELIASIKSAGPAGLGKAGAGLDELSEAQRETTAALNAFNLKLEKSVERAVAAALAKSETSGVDQAALARSVAESVGSRLMPARIGLVAGALAIVAAVSFVAGVMINKSGYDKYIAELEGKIQGYQSVLVQQKGPER
jgi:hypothetical protein